MLSQWISWSGFPCSFKIMQEKTTFVQLSAKPNLRSAVMQLPAALQVMLLATGAAVLYHHASPASGSTKGSTSVVVETAEVLGEGRSSFEVAPLRSDYSAEDEHMS